MTENKPRAGAGRMPATALVLEAEDMVRRLLINQLAVLGFNAVEASQVMGMTGETTKKFLAETTLRAVNDLKEHGFRMLDIKPEHVVLRVLSKDSLLRCRTGEPAYALVDYELLERIA